MWKQGLLVVLSLTVLNAEIWNEGPKKFTPGSEYKFDYDAQILTGVPISSWHYTGYRLKAQVRLSIQDMSNIVLRLEQIRFMRMTNTEINVDEPNVFLPEDMFQGLSENQLAQMINAELVRPLRFSWNNGVVGRVQVDVKDQFWSINMKKGLLNMINMDLTTRGQEDRSRWNGAYRQSSYEDGIEGQCRSVYYWNQLPIAIVTEGGSNPEQKNQNSESNPSDSIAITMVKTRDSLDCLETVGFEHALFLQKSCDEKRMNVSRNVIRSEATTRANITYWSKSKEYFMWEVKTTARYTFAPVNAHQGSISTFVVQNLTFVGQSGQGDKDSQGKSPNKEGESGVQWKQEESLRMSDPVSETMPMKNATEILNRVVSDLLQQIRTQLKEKNSQVMDLIQEWITYLRQAPKDVLMKVHQECMQRLHEEPEIFNLFHDILPTVATKEALETYLQIILSTTSSPSTPIGSAAATSLSDGTIARRVRSFSVMNHVGDKEMIRMVMNAIESPALQTNPQRRETLKALIMTLGTLVNTHTHRVAYSSSSKTTVLRPEESMEDVKTQAVNFFQKLLDKDIPNFSKQGKTIVVLKALGNAGLRRGFPILTKLLYSPDKQVPTSVKVQCIYSMRTMASVLPEEVRKNVLPIFFDVNQDAELRIASYLIGIRTQPSRAVLDSIVESIRREPVKQVQSFVLSHMQKLVNSPCHCDCQMVKNISHILETVEIPADAGVQYSHSHHIPITSTESAVLRSGIIFTPDDFLPRSGNFRVLSHGNGRETNLLEMGFRADGLQKLLSKLVGPSGKIFSLENLKQMLKSFESSDKLSDANFSFYLKLFGEELGFWTLDEQVVSTMQEGLLSVSNNLVQFLHGGSNSKLPWDMRYTHFTDATIRVPTVFGLPFTANMSLLLHAQINGQVQMKRGIFDREKTQVQMQMTPSIVSQVSIAAGIDATVSKSLIQIKLNAVVPEVKDLNVNIQYVKEGEVGFRVHVQRPKTEWRLMQVKSSLQAILQESKQNGDWSIHKSPLPMKYNSKEEEKKTASSGTSGEPYQSTNLDMQPLGLQINTQMSSRPQILLRRPVHFFLRGPFQLNVTLKNQDNRQDGIELRIIKSSKKGGQGSNVEDSEGSNTVVVKLLRSEVNQDTEGNQGSNTDNVPKNPKFNPNPRPFSSSPESGQQGQGESVLSELLLQVKNVEQSDVNITATLTVPIPSGSNTKYTLTAVISPPKRTIQFQPEKPLHVEYNPSENNIFNLKCRLWKGEKEILKYKMSFDMDEVAQTLFQRMSENIEDFQAMHPHIRQCAQDVKQKLSNSVACFFTWRYMNLFNRWNHTIIVPKSAPVLLKSIVTYFMTQSLSTTGYRMGTIRLIDTDMDTDVIPSPKTDDFLQKTDPSDKMYVTSITTSPFDLRLRTVNYIFDTTLLRVPHVVLPAMYLSHIHPSDQSMYTSLVRYFTERLYPATCYLHTSEERALHVQTFDGLMYNKYQPDFNKAIVLAQDTQNNFQISMKGYPQPRTMTLQIITRDMQEPVLITRDYSTKAMQLYIGSKPVPLVNNQLPYVRRNNANQTLVLVNHVDKYPYGGDNVIQVYFPSTELTVTLDLLSIVHIQVSPFYHSTLRGVCGDFDGERRQEVKSTDCKKFYVHPEQIFDSSEYQTPISQDQSSASISIGSDKISNPTWMSLKACEKSVRLMPTVSGMKNFNPTPGRQ